MIFGRYFKWRDRPKYRTTKYRPTKYRQNPPRGGDWYFRGFRQYLVNILRQYLKQYLGPTTTKERLDRDPPNLNTILSSATRILGVCKGSGAVTAVAERRRQRQRGSAAAGHQRQASRQQGVSRALWQQGGGNSMSAVIAWWRWWRRWWRRQRSGSIQLAARRKCSGSAVSSGHGVITAVQHLCIATVSKTAMVGAQTINN